jgi:microcystin-dependent protein
MIRRFVFDGVAGLTGASHINIQSANDVSIDAVDTKSVSIGASTARGVLLGNDSACNTVAGHTTLTHDVTVGANACSIHAKTGNIDTIGDVHAKNIEATNIDAQWISCASSVSAASVQATESVSAATINASSSIMQNDAVLLPAGVVSPYAGVAAPAGYLLCDGAAVSRTTYAALFAVIGTAYGVGNGSTTFNVPDLRARFVIGVSGTYALAAVGGAATKTLGVSEIPSHTHTGSTESEGAHTHAITDPSHVHETTNAKDKGEFTNTVGQAPAGDATVNTVKGYPTKAATTGISINSAGAHAHLFTTNATGGGSSFSILPPYVAMQYIIKA